MRDVIRRGAAVAALLALVASSGCTINAPARRAPALYDLGQDTVATASHPYRIGGTLLIPQVEAPPWLDTSSIAYRLGYDDPKRLRAYNESRWTAPPAVLLTDALRSRFAESTERVVSGVDGARADRVLRVNLEDYSQTFESPRHSRVQLRARVTLLDRATRNIVAQRTFRIERPARANAAGAASALADASSVLVENLLDWVAQNLKNTATGDRHAGE